ncbi:hypothetical protein [Gymnodinialimonas ceratoperidinii]|uniref:DUF3618 domain-containing protein n=1 Tax=Gymnodinialimonas ceratoperidinii TaxID=2856823 RepID=A0A8F6YA14_9RHOB|nr:hypothetical protein [Gymnodinialimonas ceratoperidinii]QXT39098.1 hypothetical protein KYE46_14370 [Gymnodinialimonas ceratoperidinii]
MPSTREIEAELQAERDVLQAQIAALEAQFSPDRIVAKATSVLSDLGSSAATTARRNPGPFVVTAGGLAWLAFKAATNNTGPRVDYDRTSSDPVGGFRRDTPSMAGFDERVAAADRALHGEDNVFYPEGDYSMTDTSTNTGNSRMGKAKERLYETSESLRSRIEDGLDGLPDGAKDRIRKARETAISVHSRAEQEAARAAAAARHTMQENPLLVGALAVAAGAALAMMLPRTQVEDRTIGAQRDRLFDEAERLFREEKAKLQSTAEDMVAEGQKRVKESLSSDDSETGTKSASKSTGSSTTGTSSGTTSQPNLAS